MPDEIRRLDDMSSDIKQLLVGMAEMRGLLTALKSDSDDHEKRIRLLEAWRLLQIGAALGAGGGAGALVAKLMGVH